MTLEQLCVNLELSKKLKKAGFPQTSLFYWCIPEGGQDGDRFLSFSGGASFCNQDACSFNHDYISAYTASELGEMLPVTCHTTRFEQGYKYQCHYEIYNMDKEKFEYLHHTADDTEANAKAKMLLYLKKEGLLE